MYKTFALAALVSAATTGAFAETSLEPVNYSCANDQILRVVYVAGADGMNFAIIEQMGELVAMEQTTSASGEIYKAISPDYTYVLSTEKGEAMLEADGKVFLSECKQ